jgi:hypothetical protein
MRRGRLVCRPHPQKAILTGMSAANASVIPEDVAVVEAGEGST